MKDISSLPFWAAKDLKNGCSLAWRSVPLEKIFRIHASCRLVCLESSPGLDSWA